MKRTRLMAAAAACTIAAALAPNMAQGAAPVARTGSAAAAAATVAAEQARAGSVAQALGLGSSERLVVRSVTRDANGTTHVRYARTFAGLRVIGGDFVTHTTAAGRRDVSWNLGGKVAVASTVAKVAPAAAMAKSGGSAAELVVFVTASGPRLAYDAVRSGMGADQTPSRLHTVVDATSGATLASWDDIQTGTGKGIFVGTVSIGTSGSAGAYTMRDTIGHSTTDLKNRTSGSGTTFADADNIWGNFTVSDRASAGVDAHYGAEMTYSYYLNTLGRAGIWNNGTGARSRVHYGRNYVNAFWDGTQMTYGDGASNLHPLTELDVAGHEMSHGVTENTAALVYSGESGGLNEATSDIFGTAVEWYAANPVDVPDYLIGEMINLNGNGTPLRYMDQPSKDGKSADCWSSTVGSLNVHYSSGPLNHWYYLASEGSGAKTINGVSYNSPTCNASTVTGIGHLKAEQVWYRALSVYLTSSSNYAAAREASIRAAKDLYGVGSAECSSVAAAFSAINVKAGAQSCSVA